LLIERQIADAEALPVGESRASTVKVPPAPVLSPTAKQLEEAVARLEDAKLRFTPDHPDLLSLQRMVADLEARVAAEPPPPIPLDMPEEGPSPQELANQRRIRELNADLEIIDRQLAASEAEQVRLKQVLSSYQARVDVLPTRESELVELTRDYGTLDTAYSSLLMKREESKIAANLERRQIGEQFRILDPASLPQSPYNQYQRLGMMASGAIGGIFLGVLLVGVLEYRDSSFRREEEVVRLLSLPVLALIPVILGDGERRARRRRSLAMDVVGFTILLGSVAFLAHWRLST
jgi:uncharacterized protein involved in exopolysaccharide biosynthesis